MLLPILAMFIVLVSGCMLASESIGYCADRSELGSSSFCYDSVQQYICLPIPRITWASYDVGYRDEVVEKIFMSYIGTRLLSEYVYRNTSSEIISNNRACYDAYKKFLCEFNLPKCDSASDATQSVCRSVCTDFYSLCGSSEEACDIIYENMFPGLDETC